MARLLLPCPISMRQADSISCFGCDACTAELIFSHFQSTTGMCLLLLSSCLFRQKNACVQVVDKLEPYRPMKGFHRIVLTLKVQVEECESQECRPTRLDERYILLCHQRTTVDVSFDPEESLSRWLRQPPRFHVHPLVLANHDE